MATEVSGGAVLADGGRRWYQSDGHGPAGQVVDRYATASQLVERFIADSIDGYLHMSVNECFLTVFRKGEYGAALFEQGSHGTDHRQWITVGVGLAVSGWTTGWLDYEGPVPDDSIVITDAIYQALREFLETSVRPTCLQWRELTVPTWQTG